MAIVTLSCRRFRNLKDTEVAFDRGLTVCAGANGQGKTNVLEAVYFLATTRSFRRASPSEMIAQGSRGFDLAGTIVGRGLTNGLRVHYGAAGLMRFKDDKRVSPETYLPVLKTVAVSTSQMAIIDGGPEERRRFMDRGIMSSYPGYLAALTRFNRVRRQRNAALKAPGS